MNKLMNKKKAQNILLVVSGIILTLPVALHAETLPTFPSGNKKGDSPSLKDSSSKDREVPRLLIDILTSATDSDLQSMGTKNFTKPFRKISLDNKPQMAPKLATTAIENSPFVKNPVTKEETGKHFALDMLLSWALENNDTQVFQDLYDQMVHRSHPGDKKAQIIFQIISQELGKSEKEINRELDALNTLHFEAIVADFSKKEVKDWEILRNDKDKFLNKVIAHKAKVENLLALIKLKDKNAGTPHAAQNSMETTSGTQLNIHKSAAPQ